MTRESREWVQKWGKTRTLHDKFRMNKGKNCQEVIFEINSKSLILWFCEQIMQKKWKIWKTWKSLNVRKTRNRDMRQNVKTLKTRKYAKNVYFQIILGMKIQMRHFEWFANSMLHTYSMNGYLFNSIDQKTVKSFIWKIEIFCAIKRSVKCRKTCVCGSKAAVYTTAWLVAHQALKAQLVWGACHREAAAA